MHVPWARFPELQVDPWSQRYGVSAESLALLLGGFTADLAVDDDGLVVTYGNELWRQVAP